MGRAATTQATTRSWFGRARQRRPYDVEADWTLLTGCNYRCGYCFFDPASLGAKIQAVASPQEWGDAFDATDLTWLLHLTGGEPTAYPDFVGLAAALTRRHLISVNTNLSLDTILQFIGAIDPAAVRYVHASFHPVERDRRHGVDGFIRRATALRAAGFSAIITAVATPELLADFDEVVAPIRAAGLAIAPKILRSVYRGRHYPRAYTDLDKARFRAASAAGRAAYAELMASMDEPPTIDVFQDDGYLDGIPAFRGRSCEAGARFVAIDAQGTVVRCGDRSTALGNLRDGSFRLLQRATPCDSNYCVYFCQKYAAPENMRRRLLAAARHLWA